jgi:hypothetical protein
MKTLGRLAAGVIILLLCLSAMGTIVAIFVPALRAVWLLPQPFLYNAETLVAAPTRIVPALPSIALLFGCVFLVAYVLRWGFGGGRRDDRRHFPRDAERKPDNDLESIARDLHHTARRLEERLEALETILLDRTKVAALNRPPGGT